MPPVSLRTARGNSILAALPKTTLDRIIGSLDPLTLPMRYVLQKRGRPLEHVVFPLVGVASMVSMGDAGESVEVATIGFEGMIGLPLFLGGETASVEVFMQVPGDGLRMAAAVFRDHIETDRPLVRALLLYTQALLTQIAQCSACNQHHTMVGRCARWLLQTHDRVKGDQFPLTHEFLGLMLGVRRATVTETAQTLQADGLIRYFRGTITVLDRDGLEKAACVCYGLIEGEFARLTAAMKRQAPNRSVRGRTELSMLRSGVQSARSRSASPRAAARSCLRSVGSSVVRAISIPPTHRLTMTCALRLPCRSLFGKTARKTSSMLSTSCVYAARAASLRAQRPTATRSAGSACRRPPAFRRSDTCPPRARRALAASDASGCVRDAPQTDCSW